MEEREKGGWCEKGTKRDGGTEITVKAEMLFCFFKEMTPANVIGLLQHTISPDATSGIQQLFH